MEMPEPIKANSLYPAITVVIPVFNLELYLRDAVRSAQGQTYQGPVSIVVLDDGSTDNSLEVARKLAESCTNLRVYTQPNQGRSAARNRLVQLADTELIAWLDGDDIAAPRWLEQQLELLSSQENYSAVSAQGYAMTADAYPIGPIERPLSSEEIESRHLGGQANAFFQSAVLTKKSAIERAGGYREQYSIGEDYDLWLRIGETGSLANLDAVHLYYRVHDTSANATQGVGQRQQARDAVNEARAKRGLASLPTSADEVIPPKKDDWNRCIYWIHIAHQSGNPLTAIKLLRSAIAKHPTSLLLWLHALLAIADCILIRGNATPRFVAGAEARIGRLPNFSFYRLASALNRFRHRLTHRA
ncbi:MAG: glycosyltransferase family 2 protein [Pirellulaceae bacterium]|nr:glycosyltransferase family 2 protein [Pirellulaceae bacterium]